MSEVESKVVEAKEAPVKVESPSIENMIKAYDLKALGLSLKEAGLPIAEAAAEAVAAQIYKRFKLWAQKSAVLSDNKIDDVIAPFYDQLDTFVLEQIDKIDGKHS